MTASTPSGAAPRRPAGSLEELALYEDLRHGSMRAFRTLVDRHHAAMVEVASWYVDDRERAQQVVRGAWATALGGLDMFTWHSTFAAWLYGIVIDRGRSLTTSRHAQAARADRAAGGGAPATDGAAAIPPTSPLHHTAAAAAVESPDVAWSPAWSPDAWAALAAALRGLRLPAQEVVRLRDVAGWGARDACDALALTAAEERSLLLEGRSALAETVAAVVGAPPCPDARCDTPASLLHAAVEATLDPTAEEAFVRHLGDCPACTCRVRRLSTVVALLGMLPRDRTAAGVDPKLVATFRRWRVARRLTLGRRLLRAAQRRLSRQTPRR